MKSQAIVGLALLVVAGVAPVSAQVLPLGVMSQHGGVRQACHSCDAPPGGFYGGGGTVWGTECFPCNVKPGLFPPCPNPCQTTLLGELIYDVRTVVDGTLSHVFGCVFGHPCGCRGVCSCVALDCDSCAGDYWSEPTVGSSTMEPAGQPVPAIDGYRDPFRDEPTPSPPVQPVPTPSARRSILPETARTSAHQRVPRARPATMARRVSHDVPVTAVSTPEKNGPTALPSAIAAQPLQPDIAVPRHYQPRRPASMRRANGESLYQTPVRSNGVPPALRFRSAN
jgi:hypothetical protein